jgi:threonine/homoserine/homoserine lactone efflux protein
LTTEHIVAFVLFAFVAAITPGPSNIILMSMGAHVGVVRGLPCLIGVTFGMGFMIFLVALGLGRLVLAHPIALNGLKWCGVGLLLWLAWKIATAGRGDAAVTRDVVGFWQAAALQWVSPKSWLIGASAVGTYLHTEAESAFTQSMLFCFLFVLAALPSCFVWLAFGATLQRLLQTERASRRFNVVMGTLLAGSIVLFIW